jgi:hypothetical protein
MDILIGRYQKWQMQLIPISQQPMLEQIIKHVN